MPTAPPLAQGLTADRTDVPAAAGPVPPAADWNETLRVRLAANPQATPQVLHDLAEDPCITVRAAVAMNPAAPPALDRALAQDADERVRALLGRKLAVLIPQMRGDQREDVGRQVLATLAALVQDEAMRVRAAIADAVKDMPQAPHALIMQLARDSAVPVCGPVIRLSPVLNAADLLSLLGEAPTSTTALAIACRPGLDETVCDAIAATADSAVIAALLANPSAAIRETTLDALVARAAAHESWHDPLVHRPCLSGHAARLLGDIVADHLLQVLASRSDLDPGVLAELQQRLGERLAPPPPPTRAAPTLEEAAARARSLFARGLLDEIAVCDAAQRGDLQLCAAMLAVAADMAPPSVERAARLRDAKGLVSLVWAGGFSMKLGLTVQTELGALPPAAALRATATGDFPLAPEEMRWQIDLLRRLAG